MLFSYLTKPNKQQQRTVKPVIQVAAPLRARFSSLSAGRRASRSIRVVQ